MLVTSPDGKHLQLAASHKPFCKASRRAECGKSACSVRRGGGWKPPYGSVNEKLPEETGRTRYIGPSEDRAHSRPHHPVETATAVLPIASPSQPPPRRLLR